MKETIEETTMGRLGDVRTGMASMGKGTYTLPDGSEVDGMSCVLAPDGEENVIVGLGSVVGIQGVQWEVVGIEKNRGEPGNITLQVLGSPSEPDVGSGNSALDFRFRTDCPACGEVAGWNGGTDTELGDPVLCMVCPGCGDEFVWYSGALQAILKDAPPTFMPGSKPGP